MDPIYVVGHRNPDTDSIISAMAYAALRNALGERAYIPARLGTISDETSLILKRFGLQPPAAIHNVRTQVRDLDYDTPPVLNGGLNVSRAWEILCGDPSITTLPVTDDNGDLLGMLTSGDIAAYDMNSIQNPHVDQVPVFNVLNALEGKIVNDSDTQADVISGDVTIALPRAHGMSVFSGKDSIVLCGQQEDVAEQAVAAGVSCVILCQAEPSEKLRNTGAETCIITTPFDPYRAARMLYLSTPISRICRKGKIISFRLDDYIDDVREIVLKSRYRGYPILDENGSVVGTLARYHLLRPRRKRVVLVDHNERAQSVPGLEQAEILEIIDHHRLADIETSAPIYFRNEPVGSTATIVAEIYQEKGLMPTEKIAGLLASAIISDTVMFKSPTCTERDRNMAARMARIAHVTLDELGRIIFERSVSEGKSASELLYSDFKEFHIAGHDLGIGQITCLDSEKLLERKDEFLKAMRAAMSEKRYFMMILMVTDVLRNGTQIIYLGDDDTIRAAFNVEASENTVFLPKVMSRKKQVIPMLSVLWG